MDSILGMIPARYLGAVTAVISICGIISIALPGPKSTTGAYYYAYQTVNWIALNMGHARNLSAPESKGIVGGPGAVSAPQIATASVPAPVKA